MSKNEPKSQHVPTIDELTERRAEQVSKIVIFTVADRQDAATHLALGCLYLAAGMAGDVKTEQRAIKP